MSFKIGDVVIKTTGGNKMTISEKLTTGYRCFWFVENTLYEGFFNEEEIVTLTEYQRILKKEERDDKINKLLSSTPVRPLWDSSTKS